MQPPFDPRPEPANFVCSLAVRRVFGGREPSRERILVVDAAGDEGLGQNLSEFAVRTLAQQAGGMASTLAAAWHLVEDEREWPSRRLDDAQGRRGGFYVGDAGARRNEAEVGTHDRRPGDRSHAR